MNALVVYESLWGNTAAVAREIAAALGSGVRAVPTDDVAPASVVGLDLLVVGSPVHAMGLPSAKTLETAAGYPDDPNHAPANTDHLLMRDWLAQLPRIETSVAAFDTRVRGPLGFGASRAIERELVARGGVVAARRRGFKVTLGRGGKHEADLLLPGQIDAARKWGEQIAASLSRTSAPR